MIAIQMDMHYWSPGVVDKAPTYLSLMMTICAFWSFLQMNMGEICKAFSVGGDLIIKHAFAKLRMVHLKFF
ncbi:hypothetical protein EWB75_20440 [Salmonella enterica subsp. enterica serovar Bareilly]|nr:hypothetical protein [Salmonella enterica subsp. enterica serovar Bareilly]